MKRIVLLRHGESTWNKDNRFTGWTDVDLTEKGIADANQAGILLKEKGFHFDKAYTSFLKRVVKTLNCVLDKMDQDWIPVEKSWKVCRNTRCAFFFFIDYKNRLIFLSCDILRISLIYAFSTSK